MRFFRGWIDDRDTSQSLIMTRHIPAIVPRPQPLDRTALALASPHGTISLRPPEEESAVFAIADALFLAIDRHDAQQTRALMRDLYRATHAVRLAYGFLTSDARAP